MIRKSSFVNGHIADIDQSYRIIKLLGKGSYGEVFRVQNKETGQLYACKKLIKTKIRRKKRFKMEIDLLKATDHPNIIKLYDIYEDKVSIFLIMEECMGGEFFERLSKRARSRQMYTEKEAAKIFKQILEAVNYLHSHGVCHRDLKPENILFSSVEEDSPIKLIDFGLSQVLSSEGILMNEPVGTTFYMAPEVIKGSYNEKCDIWSCGIILYIMLCGRPPFYSNNENELKKKIIDMKYSLDILSNVSDDAKELIKSILVNQDDRPSASDLLDTKWIKELAPNSRNEALNVDWFHMKKYCKLNLVQKCVCNFTAFRLNDKETENFVKMFKSLDENNDGVLTLSEIKQAIENSVLGNKIEADELIELFNELDVDKNGLINYTEFVSGLMDYSKYVKKTTLVDCFKNYDLDGNGTISYDEFLDMIKPKDEEEERKLKYLYGKFDLNGDGKIDFEEFVEGVMDTDVPF